MDERNAQRSLENALNHFDIAAKLGISPSALEYKIRLFKINKHQFKKYLREG